MGGWCDWAGRYVNDICGFCFFWRRGWWLTKCRRHNGVEGTFGRNTDGNGSVGSVSCNGQASVMWAAMAFSGGVEEARQVVPGQRRRRQLVP